MIFMLIMLVKYSIEIRYLLWCIWYSCMMLWMLVMLNVVQIMIVVSVVCGMKMSRVGVVMSSIVMYVVVMRFVIWFWVLVVIVIGVCDVLLLIVYFCVMLVSRLVVLSVISFWLWFGVLFVCVDSVCDSMLMLVNDISVMVIVLDVSVFRLVSEMVGRCGVGRLVGSVLIVGILCNGGRWVMIVVVSMVINMLGQCGVICLNRMMVVSIVILSRLVVIENWLFVSVCMICGMLENMLLVDIGMFNSLGSCLSVSVMVMLFR